MYLSSQPKAQRTNCQRKKNDKETSKENPAGETSITLAVMTVVGFEPHRQIENPEKESGEERN